MTKLYLKLVQISTERNPVSGKSSVSGIPSLRDLSCLTICLFEMHPVKVMELPDFKGLEREIVFLTDKCLTPVGYTGLLFKFLDDTHDRSSLFVENFENSQDSRSAIAPTERAVDAIARGGSCQTRYRSGKIKCIH